MGIIFLGNKLKETVNSRKSDSQILPQGQVVRKPVNTNPGFKVNQSVPTFCVV